MARDSRVGMGLLDRLVLLLAWIATCGLVYLLGFYVGKGMQERRLGLEERIVRLPVSSQPPAEGRRQKSESEFGFYDKLMGEHAGDRAAAPVVTPPVRVATAPVSPPAHVATVTIGPPAPAGAAVKSTPPAPPPPAVAKATATPPAPAPAAAKPSPAPAPAKPTSPPAAAPAARPAPAAAPLPADAQQPVQPAAVTAAAPPVGGGWTVLANPTQSREEADGLLRQLRGRGYDATLVRVLRDGGTWYRIQVGRFATSEQASEVMRRLREHEGVPHVFVASE